MRLTCIYKKFLLPGFSALIIAFTANSAWASSGSGFSIAPPPLGYASYYMEESPKRHRVDISYLYFDLVNVSKVQGGSVYANSRIVGGSWGSVSLQYGGFYLFGKDKGAYDMGGGIMEDVDLNLSGFNVVPTAEIALFRSSREAGQGFMLTSFVGIDLGYQFFKQKFSDGKASYHSRFAGPLAGVQAHIPVWSTLISPFFMAKHIRGKSVDGDMTSSFHFNIIGYGFDIVWHGFSLSGIMQAATKSKDKTYTVSIGFGF